MYPDRAERYISLVVRLFLPAFNTRFHRCLPRPGRLSTDPYRSILFIDCRFIIRFFFSTVPSLFAPACVCFSFYSLLFVTRVVRTAIYTESRGKVGIIGETFKKHRAAKWFLS